MFLSTDHSIGNIKKHKNNKLFNIMFEIFTVIIVIIKYIMIYLITKVWNTYIKLL